MLTTIPMKGAAAKTARAVCLVLILCAACLGPYTAWAEEEPLRDPAREDSGAEPVFSLPPITVTADKRETELQKTPIPVTVIGQQELEDAGVRTVSDAMKYVPNLVITKGLGGDIRMSFRGAVSVDGTRVSPLVMYLDGVPVDTYFNFDANLMDVERVEVLRGPQSAIYGKNALGGVINIVTKKPGNEYGGKATAYVEDSGTYGASVLGRGPLVEDKLFLSLSAMHDYKHGYMKNDNGDYNFERTERLKGILRFTPSEKAEFTLHMDYTAGRNGFYPFRLGQSGRPRNHASGDDFQHDNTFNAALLSKFSLEHVIFESITTFRNENIDYRLDYMSIMPPVGVVEKETYRKEFTQEFRLRSPEDQERWAWLVGVYGGYSDMHVKRFEASMPSFMFSYNSPTREFSNEFAPFGQLEIPVTDKFKVTAGLRWHYTKRNFKWKYMDNYGTDISEHLSDSWSELLPKLTLSYQLTNDHMLFAGVGRSFIPGGYNWASLDGKKLTYDSQTAWNYEAGAKTNWLDNRISANVTFFYNKFEDLQVMNWVGPGVTEYAAENAASASSWGAELELTALLTEGLTADVSLGYTRAKYDSYTKHNANGDVNLSGYTMQITPEFTAVAGLTYRHDSGFMARCNMNYFSSMYWDAAHRAKRAPVTTVDARIGYETEQFGVYLYGRNVFGERYQQYYYPDSDVGLVAEPQTFGLEISYNF